MKNKTYRRLMHWAARSDFRSIMFSSAASIVVIFLVNRESHFEQPRHGL